MNQSDRKQNRPLIKPLAHWHLIAAFLIVYDFVAVVATWFLALRLRFDGRFAAIPAQYFLPYKRLHSSLCPFLHSCFRFLPHVPQHVVLSQLF